MLHKFNLRFIETDSDFKKLLFLQEETYESIENKELFQKDTEQFLKSHIKDRGKILGIFLGEVLVAYGILAFPGIDDDNLGIDLSIEDLDKVAHLDVCVVRNEFRGSGIQLILCKVRESLAKELGYIHLCSTVHPDNKASLRNLEKLGMNIVLTKEKYGGKIRNILYKNLN